MSASVVRGVASKRVGRVLMLVLGKEHGAMGRRQGPFEFWRLTGGRECEVMGGESVQWSVGWLWISVDDDVVESK